MDKEEFRKLILQRRGSLDKVEVKKKSKAVCVKLVDSLPFTTAKNIMFYMSVNNEVDLQEAMESVRGRKNIILPKTDLQNVKIVPYKVSNPQDDLEAGAFGIPEPKRTSQLFDKEELNLILVPGVAFDLQGNRIGHGKGYYDRFLKETSALKMGIAYEFQIVDSINTEEYDIPVDFIITEKRIIECENHPTGL